MTLTFLDLALPVGLALVFAVFRYSQYVRAGESQAVAKAAADGLKGAIGLGIITLGYKFITTN
jgi:hypothetical protein